LNRALQRAAYFIDLTGGDLVEKRQADYPVCYELSVRQWRYRCVQSLKHWLPMQWSEIFPSRNALARQRVTNPITIIASEMISKAHRIHEPTDPADAAR
jgi:hypothetical protein